MAGLGLIGLVPVAGDGIKKGFKTFLLSRTLNNNIKRSSRFINEKVTPKLYGEEMIKQKGRIKQGVQTLGVHRKYGTGNITGSQDVTDPDNIGPIKYELSRTNISVTKEPKKLFQIENFNQYYTNPRGLYIPNGLKFDKIINMSLNERPQIVGRFKDSNNITVFPYRREA